MITYLKSSVFDSPAHALVNTVNTVGVMGKGIAATFKQLYPQMFREYRRLCVEGQLDIGKLHIYRTPNKIIVNFPTKQDWRNPSRVEYIDAGLRKFTERYGDYGISSVSFPQLGCGNGELSWQKQVQPLMERYLQPLPIPVYIHLYPAAADFVPERFDRAAIRQMQIERQHLSIDDMWGDLREIIGRSENQLSLSLFGPQVAIVEDEYVAFTPPGSDKPLLVHRDDIEEIWNTLRLRGTVQEADMPQQMRDQGASEWLMDLLQTLKYVKPVSLQPSGATTYQRGLQYMPPPQAKNKKQKPVELVV